MITPAPCLPPEGTGHFSKSVYSQKQVGHNFFVTVGHFSLVISMPASFGALVYLIRQALLSIFLSLDGMRFIFLMSLSQYANQASGYNPP